VLTTTLAAADPDTMHHTLGRDHLALVLIAALVVALWPGGSLTPLAEAGLYIAPLALFVGSLAAFDRVDRAGD
jgi:hypothetical protein